MFINDKYGGHLSKSGNDYIAKIINLKLNRIIKELNAKKPIDQNNYTYWKRDGQI